MVLYQVISTYQLLNAITHKLTVHPEDDCVLIISNWLVDKFPHYDDLTRFFKKVIPMNAQMSLSDKYHELNTQYCENLLESNQLSIENFDEIHAMGYHYNFGAYLSHNNIKHNFWEDAAGLLSAPEILININRNGFPLLAEFCEKEHLYDGTANGIEKRYCNYNAQKNDFNFENTVDFDVVKSLMTLDEETQADVIAFFSDVEKMSVNENAVLILTQQLFSLRVLSFEEQALIYQLFVDYFIEEDSIVFKPHPDDYMFYGILFPESTVIRKKFPAEFLPILFSNKPRKIATISSTAMNNLKGYFDEALYLGPRFEKEFKNTHRYKVAYELKNQLFNDYSLLSIGVNEFYKDAFKVSDDAGSDKRFVIVDKIASQDEYKYSDIIKMLEDSDEKDVFVFINSSEDYCFYDTEHKQIWENLAPLVINKTQIRSEEFYESEGEDIIYIFAKDKNLLNKAQGFDFSYELKHTGLAVSTAKLDVNKRNILLLQALLLATESRLLAYETLEKNKDNEKIIPPINEENVISIRYSDENSSIEQLSEEQNKMRILEGIIRSTERRLIFCTI